MKRVPVILVEKVNQYVTLHKIDNPGQTDDKLEKRTTMTVMQKLLKNQGYAAASKYISGKIVLEKKRLTFTELLEKFKAYQNEIKERFPTMPNSFPPNIWYLLLNQALVRGEASSIELLSEIKSKNIKTLETKIVEDAVSSEA